MIGFKNFTPTGRNGEYIVAEIEGSQGGTHFIAEKGRWERNSTPAIDAEGRPLARIMVQATADVSVEGLESGEQELGAYAFEHWPPTYPGEYAVREGVEVVFVHGYSSGGAEGGSTHFRGPSLVLRELVPPDQLTQLAL